MGNMLGGATCILTCTSHTGWEFSEKFVRTTLTNKTCQLVIQHSLILFSDEWIDAQFGPALAHKFSQKAAWAPTFSTRSRNIFITISWDFSYRSERYWTALFL